MATFAVELAELAQTDLFSIGKYLSDEVSVAEAKKQITKIRGATRLLEYMPYRFALSAELGTNRRVLVCSPWRIVYRISVDTVFVQRILHERQHMGLSIAFDPSC